jgi:glycosyltransferase involved in cell wall biosynthesis
MANYAYWIVKKLREDMVDAELLMNNNPINSSNPIQYDESLNHKYPDWITFYDTSRKFWQLQIIKKMRNNYDIIHSYVELPILASFSGRKFIANVQGSDLREMAFSKNIKGILLRRAYKKAKAVIIPGVEGFSLLEKLNIKNGIFIPAFTDLNGFSSTESERISSNEKLTIFHPSHQLWNVKGNDILIKGFKKFIQYYPQSNLILIKHGQDSKKSETLIKKLNLEKNITFLEGTLNHNELKKMYNSSDIIADQFLIGELGGIGREALCMKKPLLTCCWMDKYIELFSDKPPVAHASTPEQVNEQLLLLSNKKYRDRISQDGYSWICKHYNPDTISKKIIFLYEEILNNTHIETIKEKIMNI